MRGMEATRSSFPHRGQWTWELQKQSKDKKSQIYIQMISQESILQATSFHCFIQAFVDNIYYISSSPSSRRHHTEKRLSVNFSCKDELFTLCSTMKHTTDRSRGKGRSRCYKGCDEGELHGQATEIEHHSSRTLNPRDLLLQPWALSTAKTMGSVKWCQSAARHASNFQLLPPQKRRRHRLCCRVPFEFCLEQQISTYGLMLWPHFTDDARSDSAGE